MPQKIAAWKCCFCSLYRINKASITHHEKICFHNPDRKILEGELAIWATFPRELMQHNSYGVPGSDWLEPMDYHGMSDHLKAKYKWWPMEEGEFGLGFIYQNGAWVKIDGYKPPHFAPGACRREEVLPSHTPIPFWSEREER